MSFVPFDKFFPEVAEREIRSVNVTEPILDLPAGEYGFFESYCDDPGCDCRRVLLTVISRRLGPLAVLNFGWENLDFYRRWATFGGRKVAKEIKGPSLHLGSPQSKLAPTLLRFFEEVLLQDAAYIKRLEKHYWMVREAVDGKTAPASRERLDRKQKKRLLARKTRELHQRRLTQRKRVS